METIVADDSPLADYLEGRGEADSSHDHDQHQVNAADSNDAASNSFAPRGPPALRLGPVHFDLTPLLDRSLLNRLRNAYASAFDYSLGKEENDRFLEHFRYIIIASHLLTESNSNAGPTAASSTAAAADATRRDRTTPLFLSASGISVSAHGAGISAALAFCMVWLVDWARGGSRGAPTPARIAAALVAILVTATAIFIYVRRRRLQKLRRRAISVASSLVTNIQTFEASSTAIIALIQEVELVSRGFRVSTPLPPVSRLEGQSQQRQCLRLRRGLDSTLAKAIPAFLGVAEKLSQMVEADDMTQLYDVYDVRSDDLHDAMLGHTPASDPDQNEALKHLRIHYARLCTLRRVLMCGLLALPASTRRADFSRWQLVVSEMDHLRLTVGELGQKLNEHLSDDDQLPPQSPIRHSHSPSSSSSGAAAQRRVQLQMRRISTLSTGIRSLQAKLYLLREESHRVLSSSDTETDVSELGASLMDQYESIGADLKTLMQAWETGKAALAHSIDWHERRISRASSSGSGLGLRSPISLSGPNLFSVIEGARSGNEAAGGPNTALRILNGDAPLSPPSTENGDASQSGNSSGGEEDAENANARAGNGEVFEAVAAPRNSRLPRTQTLSREQRIAKMHEERERQAVLREKRDSNMILIKELEAVIKLRPARKSRNSMAGADNNADAAPDVVDRGVENSNVSGEEREKGNDHSAPLGPHLLA